MVLATWLRLLPTSLRHLLLGAAETVHQLLIGRRLFDRIEVGALDILDDGDFQRLGVGQLAHHHRHVMQLGHLGRAPAALARHDLVACRRRWAAPGWACSTPFSLIEAARSASGSSAKVLRG